MAQQKTSTKVSSSDYIDLFLRANESKRIPRTGWVREKVQSPETVAEHSFSLSFLTMQLASPISHRLNYPLNINKLIKMAILHDIGEVETGDIVVTRWDHIDIKGRDSKERKEKDGIKKLFKATDKSHIAASLFDEMTDRITLESKIFWQLDKLDMALQALFFELEQNLDLEEFFVTSKTHISDPFLVELLEDILKRRPEKRGKA